MSFQMEIFRYAESLVANGTKRLRCVLTWSNVAELRRKGEMGATGEQRLRRSRFSGQ